jgi:hypothetical protein
MLEAFFHRVLTFHQRGNWLAGAAPEWLPPEILLAPGNHRAELNHLFRRVDIGDFVDDGLGAVLDELEEGDSITNIHIREYR